MQSRNQIKLYCYRYYKNSLLIVLFFVTVIIPFQVVFCYECLQSVSCQLSCAGEGQLIQNTFSHKYNEKN